MTLRLAMLISGGGTTAEKIIQACKSGRLKNVIPACVIASKKEIEGLQRAAKAGIDPQDILVIEPGNFNSSSEFGLEIIKQCKSRGVNFIGQYGWMCKTPANVIQEYSGMMVNQHPGPLDPGRPDFGGKGMFGKRVHAARLLFVNKTKRDFWSEATAQRVAEHFDEGAVLKAAQVPILPGDTVETLQTRMLPVEHEVQIQTLQDFSEGQVREIIREAPLVLPGEEEILEECKKQAIEMYPKG